MGKKADKVKADKVKVGLFLDKKLMENFRAMIQDKWKKYERGLLSYEAEMALRHWLSLHTKTQNAIGVDKPNPTPKTAMVFAQVKNYLLSNWYYELKPGQEVHVRHLEEAIAAVRGGDKRTIRRWMNEFHRMGLIKPMPSPSLWKVL